MTSYDSYRSVPYKKRRMVKIFGRSIPLTTILVLLTVVSVLAAGIWAYASYSKVVYTTSPALNGSWGSAPTCSALVGQGTLTTCGKDAAAGDEPMDTVDDIMGTVSWSHSQDFTADVGNDADMCLIDIVSPADLTVDSAQEGIAIAAGATLEITLDYSFTPSAPGASDTIQVDFDFDICP